MIKKALVVGINKYQNNELTVCENDANQVAFLLEKNFDGSPNFDVHKLTSSSDIVDKRKLKYYIESLFDSEVDVALFYFSGHGSLTPYGGFLVPQDSSQYDDGIGMEYLLNLANDSKIKDKIIILDCCFSGSFGKINSLKNNLSVIGDGITILTASSPNQSAFESAEGNSVFTSLLLAALDGGASDLRGNITPGSIYSFIDKALAGWNQRPVFKTNVSRFTSLKNVEPPIPGDILRKINKYFDFPYSKHNLTPEYEVTHSSAISEKVQIFKDLQKFVSVGLVVPVGEEHMYYAALNSKSCKLTSLGRYYWGLVQNNRI